MRACSGSTHRRASEGQGGTTPLCYLPTSKAPWLLTPSVTKQVIEGRASQHVDGYSVVNARDSDGSSASGGRRPVAAIRRGKSLAIRLRSTPWPLDACDLRIRPFGDFASSRRPPSRDTRRRAFWRECYRGDQQWLADVERECVVVLRDFHNVTSRAISESRFSPNN